LASGKVSHLTWVSVKEIYVQKDVYGTHYFFKVKVPDSEKYGWVESDDQFLKDRKGDCFPEFLGQ
jgi:hypothetical protein